MRLHRRGGYTLLEVILSLSIAVLLLASLYAFLGYQLRQAQSGREMIERATIARSILQRINTDIASAITLNDPTRFRRLQNQNGGGGGTPSAGTPSTGTPTTTGTGSSTSGTSSTSSTTADPTGDGSGLASATVMIPLGVMGTSSEMHIFLSRVPGEVFGPKPGEAGQITSDLRRISYWMAGEGNGGLCRMEARLITSDDALTPAIPGGDINQYIIANQVKSIEFSYFDGTGWTDSWDSSMTGEDGITPIGPPRAIAVKVGILPPVAKAVVGAGREPPVKFYRHVVPIQTANGTAAVQNPDIPETGSTTTPP